jgi:hypothetical protein
MKKWNIHLVNLVKWSLVVSGRLCSIMKPWNNVPAFITDWIILSVEDLLLPGKNIARDLDDWTSLAFPLCFAVPTCFVTSLWPPWLIERWVGSIKACQWLKEGLWVSSYLCLFNVFCFLPPIFFGLWVGHVENPTVKWEM